MKFNILGLTLIIFLNVSCFKNNQQDSISLIPLPAEMSIRDGSFTLNSKTKIVASGDALETARYLQAFLMQHAGLNLAIVGQGDNNVIRLTINGQQLDSEGYSLKVESEFVDISALSSAGLFYGVQTFRQLLPPQIERLRPSENIKWSVPAVSIEDKPFLQWRGLMLDCSRHYFAPEFIEKLLDMMAARKLNTFHWHLTDAQGWRIEIEKYPKLTEIAAWRVGRNVEEWDNPEPVRPDEKADYGGYYTQDQIREIVKYAQERHIKIIPEIEMPSHSTAVLAAYPQFSCSGKKIDVPVGRAIVKDFFSTMPELNIDPDEPMGTLFCAGNDSVYIFLKDVLDEVINLFPSEYIHIGCDEVNKRVWEICPKCQKRIRSENLTNEEGLMIYFIHQIEQHLKSKGRKAILWYEEEYLKHDLDTATGMMNWRRNHLYDLNAAKQGYQVVMVPSSYLYVSAPQGPMHMEPFSFGSFISFDSVYYFNPVSPRLNEEESKNIMGGQACLWTEAIATAEHAEYMLFPRLEALSEVLWTPEGKRDLKDFKNRMVKQLKRYNYSETIFSPSVLLVHPELTYNHDKGNMNVKLLPELEIGNIYYTLDGSNQIKKSIDYRGSFELENNAQIKAVQFQNEKPLSSVTNTEICINKAIGSKIRYGQSSNYPYNGKWDINQTINGILATTNVRDWEWIGFNRDNTIHFIIDLLRPTHIDSLKIGFLHSPDNSVFLPDTVEYHLSNDGTQFSKVKEIYAPSLNNKNSFIHRFPAKINKSASFVKIVASRKKETRKIQFENKISWMMTDEIIVW